jgi:hypothetical protein
MAVNPESLKGLDSDEKRKLLRTKGFCLQNDAPQNVLDSVKECESELSYMGSISGGKTISPGGTLSSSEKCSYLYSWSHKCQPSPSTSVPQIAENYLCTWCPSLVCKQGPKDKICSEINNRGTCKTNDTFGNIINPEKWEPNCGCPSSTLSSDIKAGIVGGTVGGGTAIALVVLLLFELL